MIAWTQHHDVTDAQVRNGNVCLRAIGILPPGVRRRQCQQLPQSTGSTSADARFKLVTDADQSNDGRRLEEIEMSAGAMEQCLDAVDKCGGRAKGYKGVHVGGTPFELPPGASVECRTSPHLHNCGQY